MGGERVREVGREEEVSAGVSYFFNVVKIPILVSYFFNVVKIPIFPPFG
jgi:hypothetical protein